MHRGAGLAAALTLLLVLPISQARADGSAASPGLVLTPATLSVTKGGEVSFTAQTDPESGSQQLSYVVIGRNDGGHGSVTTGDDGTATISYRDHGMSSNLTSDTVAVIDAAGDDAATATVDYLDGPDLAQAVVLDATGQGVDDTSCGLTDSPATAIPLASETEVCAAVSNALGEPLAGKAVTFEVSDGAVGPGGGVEPGAPMTYQSLTDRSGVAFAAVTATKPGPQQLVAMADRLSGKATISYAAPTSQDAAQISVRPSTWSLVAGKHRQVVASVVDSYGNPVPGVPVGFALAGTGVGTLGASTPGEIVTASDGTAATTIATQAGDHGAGTLTAMIEATSPACSLAGSCSATASYTVTKPVVPSDLTLEAAPGAQVGAVELVAAVVKGAGSSPAAGQIVHFGVSGADQASGSVRSNTKGVALFGYPAQRRGADTISAWVDVNRDGRHQRAEPTGTLTLVVAPQPRSSLPKK